MSEDPPSCDSDEEYHTCDEEGDDGNDDRADSGSSSSSDDGRDNYHTSDEDEDEELDVLGAVSAVSVKKETHQLYTSSIIGLDQHVQEMLESCNQPKQKQHPTSRSNKDEGISNAATPQISGPQQDKKILAVDRELVPTPRFQDNEDLSRVAGSMSRELVSTSGSQPTKDTLAVALTQNRQMVSTSGPRQIEDSLPVAGSMSRELVPTSLSQEDNILAVATTHNRQMVPTLDSFGSVGSMRKLFSYCTTLLGILIPYLIS